MQRIKELAPCGVYCGACPIYDKTCLGCSSDIKGQDTFSKWSCKVRNCCYSQKKLDYCINCEDFPCRVFRKKLLTNHSGNPAYKYRFEIPVVFPTLKSMGAVNYLRFLKEKWKCDSCDGTVLFYNYRCNKCGKKVE